MTSDVFEQLTCSSYSYCRVTIDNCIVTFGSMLLILTFCISEKICLKSNNLNLKLFAMVKSEDLETAKAVFFLR